MKLLATLVLATSISAFAEVKVEVGDISDKRTTGQFFAGLEIALKISGPELAECKALRVVVKGAKDDAGKAVEVEEDRFNEGGFQPPQKGFGSGGFGGGSGEKKKDEFELKMEFKNPARSAKSITVDGAVELLVPSKDPTATVTADVAKEAGKALDNAALKAAGVSITLKEVKGSDVGYIITDPNKKVAAVEFCSPDGKTLESNGRSTNGFAGKKDVGISLKDAAPAGVTAKIYLLTAKSVVSVPLKTLPMTLP